MTFRVLVQQNKQCSSILLLGQKLVFQGILLNRVPFLISVVMMILDFGLLEMS